MRQCERSTFSAKTSEDLPPMADEGQRRLIQRGDGEPITDRPGRTVSFLAAHDEISIPGTDWRRVRGVSP
jgi:hypothetical protein